MCSTSFSSDVLLMLLPSFRSGGGREGYLVLEDMHIKKSLMDMLELPLALGHGIIGRLEIQIPWSTLNKDPILVAVERVREREGGGGKLV